MTSHEKFIVDGNALLDELIQEGDIRVVARARDWERAVGLTCPSIEFLGLFSPKERRVATTHQQLPSDAELNSGTPFSKLRRIWYGKR